MKLQRQCSGFSLLQRRAYDLIKVVALHLLFVAYTELFHRGLVSGDCLFSDFATNAHSEVLSWMSCPHLASRGYLVKHGLTQSGVDYNKQLTYPRAVYDEVVFATERMLCSIAAIKQSCFASPVHTKEIGKNIFVVPSLLSRTDFLSVLEQLHEGEQVDKPRTVAWWSLCPHPVVYVNGEPFVLLPRENRQIVENRARYDEFVLRRLPRVAVGASTVADVARILLGKPSPDPVETIQTESGVFDGVHESMSRSREEESSPSPLDVPAATDAVSVNQFPNCFQLSLQDEEDYLKKMVLRELQTTDRVHYYTPRSVDDLLDSDKVQSFTIFTEAEDLQECTLSRKDVETQYESNQILDVLSKQPSPVASELSQRLSISKSGRRRSVERDGWQKVLERASAAASHVTSPAESTVLSPKAGSPSRASKLAQNVGSLFSGSAVPLGDTIQTTKDFVRMMSKEPHTHCTLEYHQPCLVDCAGSGWLSQYEKFLETCLVQIKSESTVVFAADQPLYFLYAMSGAILSKAIEDANVDPMGASAPARPRASSKNVQYLLDHNDERLRYFQGFYELVSAAYANVGVNVTECVMEVNALLESCGCTVLETLIRLIEKAEEEPNHVECRRLIVKATQLSEQYCYLILLKVLLSLPFSADVLHKVSKVPLTPFSSFIESTAGAVEWISTINPWAWATERDPDENKLNYSNILRRWDNGEYICFGAI
ncbi:hypothetical protein AGDE_12774 [Angomonas deanei]|uniref:Uncharacterized protein n=1 Tax=Angomonas deanei TaxID=59799 RepID=A0A7G2CCU0_9TRYP|nr:hypothetical protein AGDE_12774 [Angomonas deanei]CAD2216757.1 hypothetical protein, conserved [Angomonas deanei]|eukprot:EPY23527.1 hypothetical protein AGDE_12774 [Angomonas deanei]